MPERFTKYLDSHQPEKKPLLTRRQFLLSLGVGIGGGLYNATRKYDKIPFSSGLEESDFTYKDGLLVSGENIAFKYHDAYIIAEVNPTAFLGSIENIAKYFRLFPHFDDLRKEYPIRISLNAEKSDENVITEVGRTSRVENPSVILPTPFVRSYLDGLLRKDPEAIKENDKVIVHELVHVCQNMTGKTFDKADLFAYGFVPSMTYMTAFNVMENVNKRGKEPGESVSLTDSGISFALSMSMSIGAGEVMQEGHYNFSELEAYSLSDLVNVAPGVAKYRGQFFDFKRV